MMSLPRPESEALSRNIPVASCLQVKSLIRKCITNSDKAVIIPLQVDAELG